MASRGPSGRRRRADVTYRQRTWQTSRSRPVRCVTRNVNGGLDNLTLSDRRVGL